MNQCEIINLFEAQIRAMAVAKSVEDVVIALHNACAHGEIFNTTGEDVSSDQLEELFDHFDGILAIFK